jgi:hypothetical protein
MSYQFYDRKEAAKHQVRGEREMMRRMTTRTGHLEPERPIPAPLTEAELAEARIAVDAEEKGLSE